MGKPTKKVAARQIKKGAGAKKKTSMFNLKQKAVKVRN
jgi:hypothetical protein